MSKVIQRLLVFFIGLPIVIGVVVLPYYNHLALHLLILFASICTANELHDVFSKKLVLHPKPLLIALTAGIVLVSIICVLFIGNIGYTSYAFIAAVLIFMAYEVITAKTFEGSNSKLATSAFIILYSGYFFTYISKMTLFPFATIYIALFLLMVFMCDSLAWLFGNLFGKNNRGVIKASPNKSIAGFCGGIVGSILIGLIGYYVVPTYFSAIVYPGSVGKALLLGAVMGFTSITGDLVESVFKRSAECKDSGNLILGRGGMLDSVDSILFSAPIYYSLVTLLFLQHS